MLMELNAHMTMNKGSNVHTNIDGSIHIVIHVSSTTIVNNSPPCMYMCVYVHVLFVCACLRLALHWNPKRKPVCCCCGT